LEIDDPKAEAPRSICAQMRTAYFIMYEHLPIAKFQELCKLQSSNGLDKTFANSKVYTGHQAIREMETCLAETVSIRRSTDNKILEQEKAQKIVFISYLNIPYLNIP
jgi:hypothetical protein